MPVIPAIIAGALIGGGVSAVTSAMSASAAKKANAAAGQVNTTPNASQVVGDTANKTANAGNLGRAALISTSPSGVLGSDPTGRRKLFSND